MKPRIHVITLAVDDLGRALAFYRDGLGFDSSGIVGTEYQGDDITPAGAVAMFTLADGLILSIYPRTELAKDAGISPSAASSTECSIGHLVESRDEVDRIIEHARTAGATILGSPHERPWGIYSGYFSDPDGHLWEVIWNPRSPFSEQ